MNYIKASEVADCVELAYDSDMRKFVPCFIGPPGIGKTAGVYEVGRRKGVKVVTFILSNTVPSEVSGIRMPDNSTKKLEVFDDSRMASLEDGDILFLDEFLEADRGLWSACLTLINDRVMASGRPLPDVQIVAASNPVASPGIIEASVRDRFRFFGVKFDFKDWSDWFEKEYGVRPHEGLIGRIQEDSSEYNILTPRTVVGLYRYLKNGPQSGEVWKKKLHYVTAMFDASIAEIMAQFVKQRKSKQRQIGEAVENIEGLDLHEVLTDYNGWSLKEIMTYLSGRDEWPMIQEALANIDFDDGSEDEIEW